MRLPHIGLSMRMNQNCLSTTTKLIIAVALFSITASCTRQAATIPTWEKQEIALRAANTYRNPYTDLEVWIDLKGPGFEKRVYGFWDGEETFRIRFVATLPGKWNWTTHSTPEDSGLSGNTGSLIARDWTETEKQVNPNRRGFIRATKNGHALNYADGTPFFYVADTWWACSTVRFPWKGKEPAADYVPAPGIAFEEAVQFRKAQGFNGAALIAAYPSWQKAGPRKMEDDKGTVLRSGWNIDEAENVAIMPDEEGNAPFHFPGKVPNYEDIVPDFDRINPAYFRSLDRKMQYFSDNGFVPFFESVRRDQVPAWQKYYDWPESFIRYNQYLIARYGCYNQISSGIHADVLPSRARPGQLWLDGENINKILTQHYEQYGPLPFGQPASTNISISTYQKYGHGKDTPWLSLHGVGNTPRDHRLFPLLQEMFFLPDPLPMLNNEPFYPYSANPQASRVHGDQEANTRACAYGSVLNGGLAGHIHGSQGYYLMEGDPKQIRPYIWEGLAAEKFAFAGPHMSHLKDFMLSEGTDYYDLIPDRKALSPNQREEGLEEWYLSGWSSMMRTNDNRLIMAYFETETPIAKIIGLNSGTVYKAQWFNPRTGEWSDAGNGTLNVNEDGMLQLPNFPEGGSISENDWALKLKKL